MSISTFHDLMRSLRSSPIRQLRSLSPEARAAALASLPKERAVRIAQSFLLTAREEQLPLPGPEHSSWGMIAGAGSGKTRAAAEVVVRAGLYPQICSGRIGVIGRTAAEVRDVNLYGESGILPVADALKIRIRHHRSERKLVWSDTGCRAWHYSADEPSQLRGPQHGLVWGDEVSTWAPARDGDIESYYAAKDRLRLGPHPFAVWTMTPRSDIRTLDIVNDPTTLITTSSTYANAAYLPDSYMEQMVARYEGTRIGLQELYGQILDANEGAMWSAKDIRIDQPPAFFSRICIGVDPATTVGPNSDSTGIIVAGEWQGKFWVIEDLSGRHTPNQWANIVIGRYRHYRAMRGTQVDVVAETNQGGVMIETILRTYEPSLRYRGVHAKHGKMIRAEPVAALYEQAKVFHIQEFPELEREMQTIWVKSPDRVDALVYAIVGLSGSPTSARALAR